MMAMVGGQEVAEGTVVEEASEEVVEVDFEEEGEEATLGGRLGILMLQAFKLKRGAGAPNSITANE